MIWALNRPIESTKYTSSRFTGTIALEGLVRSVADTCDGTDAETVIELYKNEATAKESHLRTGQLATLNDVEEITFGSVDLCNNDRLRGTLGNIPPEECERNYCARPIGPSTDAAAHKTAA